MSRAAWPLARFAAMYVNGHLKEDATPISPFFFIPGLEDKGQETDSQISIEDMPFEEIEANFRSYDAWYRQNNPELRMNK